MDKAKQLGIKFAQILVPDKKVNSNKWPVIACDQFTSNINYWNKAAKLVGNAPSTLHIIVPEVYLGTEGVFERIEHAKDTMIKYLEDGVLVKLPEGTILVERETPFGTRTGVMLAIDLEQYSTDYKNKPLIRATEKTVDERIPPRMKIRQGASLESPHVMLLLNDPHDTVLGELYNQRGNYPKVYDTQLMQGGGHIKGWFIDDKQTLDKLTDALYNLKQESADGMLFAVGDGNHTLASAKQVWDNFKFELPEEEREDHPMRYALVEVVNLYDHGISMHPIHRVLFGIEVPGFLRMLVEELNEMGLGAKMMYTRGANKTKTEGQNLYFESKFAKGRIEIENPKYKLAAIPLTKAIDKLLKNLPKATIDYIHGDEDFESLTRQHASLGFRMDAMTKDQLFDLVGEYGVLPRKAFSLGEAQEKRYYYECRLLIKESEQAPSQESEPQDENESAEPAPEINEPDVAEVYEPEEKPKKKFKLFGKRK